MIGTVSNQAASIVEQEALLKNLKKTDKADNKGTETKNAEKTTEDKSADFQSGSKVPKSKENYNHYVEKARQMKADLDARMMDTLFASVKNTVRKQGKGARGAFSNVTSKSTPEGLTISAEFTAKFSQAEIDQAKEDVSENGYWGVEKTSDRLLEFAKAVSKDDPSKGEALLQAVKDGFKAAEALWGGKMPDITQKTYDRTMEKFDEWMHPDKVKSDETDPNKEVDGTKDAEKTKYDYYDYNKIPR